MNGANRCSMSDLTKLWIVVLINLAILLANFGHISI